MLESRLINSIRIKNSDVLVVTPGYPTKEDPYAFQFVKTRVEAYKQRGIFCDIYCWNDDFLRKKDLLNARYEDEGLLVGLFSELKDLLSQKDYKVIVVHFFNSSLLQILYSRCQSAQIILVCHGAEILQGYIQHETSPYFLPKNPITPPSVEFKHWLNRALIDQRFNFVFVSDFLKQKAEDHLGVTFKNFNIIPNYINSQRFHFEIKSQEKRKKILILRKYSDERNYSADVSVKAILELSKHKEFKEFSIDIVGVGKAKEVLFAPLKRFPNVQFVDKFIPNDKLPAFLSNYGFMLIPTRFDTQGVMLGEGLSSGVLCLTTDIDPMRGYFSEFPKILTTSSDSLAAAVLDFFNNEAEFENYSKKLSEKVSNLFSYEQTLAKEIDLIDRLKCKSSKDEKNINIGVSQKVLTIVIPSFNVEKYLNKCIFSLLKTKNRNDLEILIINDGSSDSTKDIGEKWQDEFPGIVRLINKPNGGHGSTINLGIKEATGTYFRVLDGDDWVDYFDLDQLIDKLKILDSSVDLVLTTGRYDYVGAAEMPIIYDYPQLAPNEIYDFDLMAYEGYGFKGSVGPRLATSTFRTSCLKNIPLLSENRRYVDMEFNVFSLLNVRKLMRFEMDIYRYLIGREAQSVSFVSWGKYWKDHDFVSRRLIEFVSNLELDAGSNTKVTYFKDNILSQLISTNIYMQYRLNKFTEMKEFWRFLKDYPDILSSAIEYINKENGVQNRLVKMLKRNSLFLNIFAVIPSQKRDDLIWFKEKLTFKKVVKMLVPYGFVKIYRYLK